MRQGLIIVCRPNWPQIHVLSASALEVLRLQTCTTSFNEYLHFKYIMSHKHTITPLESDLAISNKIKYIADVIVHTCNTKTLRQTIRSEVQAHTELHESGYR